MSAFRIPEGIPFPARVIDPSDDSLELDLDGVWALMNANPQLEWNEDTVVQALAHWYLLEVEAGRAPDLPELDLPLALPPSDRLH